MDFVLSADQVDLQEAMASFVSGRFPIEFVRGIEDNGGRLDRGRWRELGETGVFGVRIPEVDGGLEMGMAESVLVFEELGRALVPGPLADTSLAASLYPGAVSGEQIVGVFERAEPVTVVEHLEDLDVLLLLDDTGVFEVDKNSLAVTKLDRPLDALTPVHLVTGEVPLGKQVGDAKVAARWRWEGAVLSSALQLGLSLQTVTLATNYAKEREQFGRVIGSFQSIKHMIAEMLVRAEVTRAAVYAAACALDGRSSDDPARAVSGAKTLAGNAAIHNAETCIQVHGGMGYTWEVDAQRYWKRANVLDTHFGNSDFHAERVAALTGS
jgi:alkylation response protein AidB-like acyl-CoA dehydrogenase